MPTTSNFGWTTPADTDLVKDGAASIRTLGNNIDASLVDLKGGTTGQVLAKASNSDLDFTWATDASGIPATIFDAKGDLIAASAADTAARLPVGTNGQVLTANSSTSTGLEWTTLAAGGKLLQVVYADTTTNTTVASTTYTDLGLSASITPSATSSKVLVICMPNIQIYRETGAIAGGIQLLRGSTVIQGNSKLQAFWQSSLSPSYIQHNQTPSIIYLDSPSTTSSTTYKIQGAVQNDANNSQISLSNSSSRSSIVLMEIGA